MEQLHSSCRIFYFCPDFPQPSGGTKKLYRHVHRLHSAGVDAAIVHQKRGFRLEWHTYAAPVIWLEDRPRFGPDDILVFPEVMRPMMEQTKGFAGQRVVVALSWDPAYARLQPGERWQDFGIEHVLTTSPTIQRHLAWSQEIDVAVIPEFIDPARYFHAPDAKARQIAYLTRKDASGEWLRGVLARRGQDKESAAEYVWRPLRNLDENEYARQLRAADIFLTTTLQEGMHVSVLEAMACGCLVIGYSGIGGGDYMASTGPEQNCLLVENGNLLALGQRVEETVSRPGAVSEQYASIIANATATASRYQDAGAETQALIDFFAGLR